MCLIYFKILVWILGDVFEKVKFKNLTLLIDTMEVLEILLF